MALSDVQFKQGSGGLGRPLAGQDFISGLIFYSSALPSGFTTSNRIKKFLSPQDALNAGIDYTYSDETKATGSYLVTAFGATGDTITISVVEPNGTVVIATYTRASTDTTTILVATGIRNAINANTVNNGGYTATLTGSTVTIIARPGLGIFPNTGTNIIVTSPGTITGTLTQFTGGVASRNAVYYYHISEFFRIQPKGVLYVGIFAVPGSYTFAEVNTMQSFATGTIRQYGVFKDAAAFATADLTAMHIANLAQDVAHAPLIGLYAADLSATTDISTLTDLSVLTAYTAGAVIGQDGGGFGAYLYKIFGKSITTLGATLGCVAEANVNEDIGWINKFNVSNGTECEILSFSNGELFSDSRVNNNLLTTLDSYRYNFLIKYIGYSGSFHSHFNMSVAISNTYAYGNDSRTIQKAKRGVYTSLLPTLNSPLILTSGGLLANSTVIYLQSLAQAPLNQMVRAGEISAFGVYIDPNQNVLSTSTINIVIQLIEDGVARQIVIPIGYTQSLSVN
jgi:Protein of unknown function (DUF2586)